MMSNTTELAIRTVIERDTEFPNLATFSVLCVDCDGQTVASLDGFLVDLGFYPGPEDLGVVHFLDGRSEHSLEAFEVLAENKSKIEDLLQGDHMSAFIHLEKAHVAPAYRGAGLTLRMMREARFVLCGFGRTVTLKAHPLEGEVSTESHLRLARYYQSDKPLNFVAVNEKARPGWLVASWDDDRPEKGDSLFWSASR